MKHVIRPRQGGKSTELIKRSAGLRYPIICRHETQARYLKQQAKDLGLEIPEPISADYIIKGIRNAKSLAVPGMIATHVLVDDAECVLQQFIMAGIKAEIDSYAITLRNDKGHELTIWGEDMNEKYGVPDTDQEPLPASDVEKSSSLTEAQINLLIVNGINNPDDYIFQDIYTETDILPPEAFDVNTVGRISVSKYMRFKNKHSGDVVEIKVDIDDIISKYYSGGKENA